MQPEITFYNFDPNFIASCVMRKDWAECWNYMQSLVESFSITRNTQYNFQLESALLDDETKRKYLEEFSGLMGELLFSLLSDPQIRIPDSNFYHLITLHEIIHNLFELSGITSSDEMAQTILKKQKKLSPLQQKKILLLSSMASSNNIVSALQKVDSEYRAFALCSYLNYIKIDDPNTHHNKINLIDYGHNLRRMLPFLINKETENQAMVSLIEAYFACTYLDYDQKHKIKHTINDIMRKYIAQYMRTSSQNLITSELPFKPNPEKPKILVLLDLFKKGHAMYRSWGAWLKSLEKDFNVILMINKQSYDAELDDQFTFSVFENLQEIVEFCDSYQPDIVLYPSVGMSAWTILASNMRLAPIQMVNLGHPASTMSDCIDFVYGQSILYNPEAFHKEIYIADESPYKFIPNLSRTELFEIPVISRSADSQDPLKIAIIGSTTKLTAPFLQTLQTIEEQSSTPIEFTFYVGSVGMDSTVLEKHLRSRYKNIVFKGYQSYQDFLRSIAQTDLVLNPFPFGHTNTIIDTLLLGKPCISLKGIEPSSLTEHYILDYVGLDDQFLTNSIDEYIEKFRELSSRIISGDTDFYNRSNVYTILFEEQNDIHVDFSTHIKAIHDNAEKIKKSGKSLVYISDYLNEDNP